MRIRPNQPSTPPYSWHHATPHQMSSSLRVLILGSGFAGQGHTQAFRSAGANVVGMASRTASVVKNIAKELDIPYASDNWQQALKDLQPDVVSIGTPGGAHYEQIMAALEQGCHVLSDKPLAATAEQAKQLFDKATEKQLKTAYAASYRYMPYVSLSKELIAAGAIGDVQEVECLSHYNLNPLIPFGWSHQRAAGGGRLNNNFTHKLSIITHALNGNILNVTGETRNDMKRAPVVTGVHDFRERRKFIPKSADDPALTWADVDAEWSYTVLASIQTPAAKEPVSALFKHSGLQPRFHDDSVAFYGQDGAIFIQGSYAQGPLFLWDKSNPDAGWQQQPLPEHITKPLPDIKDDTLRNWTCLAQAFCNDIRGEAYEPYQTFKDGWHYQQIIDQLRNHPWQTHHPQRTP